MDGTLISENLRFWKNVWVPFVYSHKKLGFEKSHLWAGLGPGLGQAGLDLGLGNEISHGCSMVRLGSESSSGAGAGGA